MLGHKHRVFWLYRKAQWLIITPILIVVSTELKLIIIYEPRYEQTGLRGF